MPRPRHGVASFSFTGTGRERMIATLVGQGLRIRDDDIRDRFVRYWTNVDTDLGADIAAKL
ncbi:catalase-related domain-containing protein [Streptosporangium sp. NPDC002544]|uniref:catalase-related domain-containing protein n=1 Tax=Streptosporangium sp. NPDC002544 TaxID=3154538 RepID=UPI0033202758